LIFPTSSYTYYDLKMTGYRNSNKVPLPLLRSALQHHNDVAENSSLQTLLLVQKQIAILIHQAIFLNTVLYMLTITKNLFFQYMDWGQSFQVADLDIIPLL